MAEHLSKELIDQYQTAGLSAQDRFDCDTHLADCDTCRKQVCDNGKIEALSNFMQTRLSIIASESSDHLTFEQIADYVNNKIDEVDRECIDSHLIWCEFCSADVKEMTQQSETILRPFRLQPSLPSHSHKGKGESLWEWGSRKPNIAKGLAYAAFLAVLFSGSYMLLRYWRASDSPAKNEAQMVASEVGKVSGVASANATETTPQSAKPSENPVTLPSSTIDLGSAKWLLPADHRLLSATLKAAEFDIPIPVKEMLRKDLSMGGKDVDISFRLLSPADEAVREIQPTLKWQALADNSKYKVVVTDISVNKNLIDRFVETTELRLNVPLEGGHSYRWQVSIKGKDDKPIYGKFSGQSYADFFFIDRNELNLVMAAERQYSDNEDPMARLALAVRYAKAGLLKDAKRELNSYLKAAPKSPHTPQVLKLLLQLESMNGR